MPYRFIFWTGCLVFFCSIARAQNFVPDQQGYVSDPAFLQFIKQHNYTLVSSFDTLSVHPVVVGAKVFQNGKWLYIDTKGQPIHIPGPLFSANTPHVPPGYSVDLPEEINVDATMNGYQIVKVDGKYGTINKKTGKPGLAAEYDQIAIMSNTGLLEFTENNLKGLARADGTILQPARFNNIQPVSVGYRNPHLAYILVWGNGKHGLLDMAGKTVFEPVYDELLQCYGCNVRNNLLITVYNKQYGLANTSGQDIVKPQYTLISPLAYSKQIKIAIGEKANLKYGTIDTNGRILLSPVYAEIKDRQQNKLVQVNAGTVIAPQYGLADSTGKIILPAACDYIYDVQYGVIAFKQNGRFGALRRDGKLIVKAEYDKIGPVNAPVVLVANGLKFGAIDMYGRIVLPIEYDMVAAAAQGIACKKDGKWQLMELKTHKMLSLDYDEIIPDKNALIVKKDGKAGVVDFTGKVAIPLKYDSVMADSYQYGVALVTLNKVPYLVDRYGNEIPSSIMKR